MKNSLKMQISISVAVLLVVIVVMYNIISSVSSSVSSPVKNTTGTPEQVADKRIADAKIVADKKIADAKIVADKMVVDAKAIETKKIADAKTAADKKIADAAAQSDQPKETEYKSYLNERYLYSIMYPNNLEKVDDHENGEGNMLESDDKKVSLQIYGTNNASNDNINSIYSKAIKKTKMYYKVKSGNWFVISYIEGDKIIYQKKVVGKGSINTFIFKFPTNEKDKYTKVVDKLESSFKAPSTDKSH
ncbi:hypothetical protein LGK95_13025 [Clostridium algoriphilum]|uniref:hypothetical protein n=1 Tax=Clostridium algoriphilum TaxID=198347 RepID=UPI001CF52AFF|nr:hypothetical protein [Clostridium algoriphilum]MCB2294432.1 hypothetical protein [Clostridium algoriphilum]